MELVVGVLALQGAFLEHLNLLNDAASARAFLLITTLAFVLHVSRDVATTEDKDFALGLLLGDDLSGSNVECAESDDESDDDAQISPLVLRVVFV